MLIRIDNLNKINEDAYIKKVIQKIPKPIKRKILAVIRVS